MGPASGVYGYDVLSPKDFLHHVSIVDHLAVPQVSGDFILQWRLDCEQTPQIWNSCADITISSSGPSPPSPPTPTPAPPAPTPAPSPPAPTPAPSPPSPGPKPGCKDREAYCRGYPKIFNPQRDCAQLYPWCMETCGCCTETPKDWCSGPVAAN